MDIKQLLEEAQKYREGTGVAQDMSKAVWFYEQAAMLGSVDAQYQLGLLYLDGAELPQDFGKARFYLEQAAKKDHAAAYFYLGTLNDLYSDFGVKQDLEEAFRCYKKSAELGTADGQYALAEFYRCGVGTERDEKEAAVWYRKAIAQGHEAAIKTAKQMDDIRPIIINRQLMEAYGLIGLGGTAVESVKEHLKVALEEYEKVISPTEKTEEAFRQICHGFGWVDYLSLPDDPTIGQLESVFERFQKGAPVTESLSESILCVYLILLRDLFKKAPQKYGAVYCDESQKLYDTCYSKFTDSDFQVALISRLICEKCSGKYCVLDPEGADKLSRHFLEFEKQKREGTLESEKTAEDFRKLYNDAQVLIREARSKRASAHDRNTSTTCASAPTSGSNEPVGQQTPGTVSKKSRKTALLICAIPYTGWFGLHRFYVGKVATGILWACTCGLCLFGWIVDLITLITGEFTDKDGNRLV